MGNCPYKSECVYLEHKIASLYKQYVCTSYAYWLTAKRFRESEIHSLVLDECHLGADISLDRAGTTINEIVRVDLGMPSFPRVKTARRSDMEKILSWMQDSMYRMRGAWVGYKQEYDRNPHNKQLVMKMRQTERMAYKIEASIEAIEHCPQAWFVNSGPGAVFYRGRPVPGLVVRPLTARYHFPRLFLGGHRTLLMSATIGDLPTFKAEFGLDDEGSCSRVVESNFRPDRRRVYLLDVPLLKYGCASSVYDRQADAIADAILNSCPSEWSGIIHVTAKKRAPELAMRLSQRGLGDRVWVPPIKEGRKYLSTREQMELWKGRLAEKPNSILIGWQFWEGYDGTEERINIVAKVPFPSLASAYERERKRYSKKFYLQRAGWNLQQALGRTRRGREEDYDTEDEMRGFCAIADGGWRIVKRYLDEDFRESMVRI